MFNKSLVSLIIVISCINTSQSIADVNNIRSMNTFNTQMEFRNWEEIKKEDVKISQKDIFELQQKQINYLEKTRKETITNKMYEISLNAGDFALKMWNDPVIRTTLILPAAFYFGDVIIGQKLTSKFGIMLYKCLTEYCKDKFGKIPQVTEIQNNKVKKLCNNNTDKSQDNKVEKVQNNKNVNSKSNTWAQINENYINDPSYLKYSIGVQQEQLKSLEKERNKGFFSRAWTGIKKVASNVKNSVVKALKSTWKDDLFKEKVVLPVANFIEKYFTSTKIGKTVTDFVGPKITKKAGDYFKENILGIKIKA